MRTAVRLLLSDDEGRPLPAGVRAVALMLGYAAAAGLLADLLLYAIDLRAQGPLSLAALALALAPFLLGALLVLATIPPIVAARRLRRWRLAFLSALDLVVSSVIALNVIVRLHDDCAKIPGCTQRAAVIYFVSFAQFLYFTALLAIWLAAIAALGRALLLALRRLE